MLYIRTYRQATLILCLVLLCFGSKNAQAERDIVFSWQRHHWENVRWDDKSVSREYTPKEAYHLYLINPDGTRRKQITFGLHSDFEPHWSSDGKQIYFLRNRKKWGRWGDYKEWEGGTSLCMIGAKGGKVVTLVRSLESLKAQARFLYHSTRTASITLIRFGYYDNQEKFYVIDDTTGRVERLPGEEATCSPDGQIWYVRYSSRTAVIFKRGSKQKVLIASPLAKPFWLNKKTLLGETLTKDKTVRYPSLLEELQLLSEKGQPKQKVALSFPEGSDKPEDWDCLPNPEYYRHWYPLKGKSPVVLLESVHQYVSSSRFGCFLVNLKTGVGTRFKYGSVKGISSDGKEVLLYDGARHSSSFEIVNIKTKKSRSLLPQSEVVGGADWRH